ncbi:MAG: hypothetical protein DI539_15130 [Flavobacterium psychrophilum]|nr:MAG: hypothetical protein DI539_15130 [Flavobacterium psychrophilum]
MKNNFLSGLTRLGVFAIAITGAFMTTSMGTADAPPFVPGHIQTGNPLNPCNQSSVTCDVEETAEVCRSGSTQLYRLTATNTCATTLYKIQP